MTSTPDNRSREEPLSAYEYGVWVFLAFAGGTALGLIAYPGVYPVAIAGNRPVCWCRPVAKAMEHCPLRLFCLSGAGRYSTEIECCYNVPINH